MRRGRAAALLSCLPTCQPGQHALVTAETGSVGDLQWQCKWTTQLKPLQKFILFCYFLETGQNHFKQQQTPLLCNLTNLLCLNQSCMKRRKRAFKS